MYALTGISLEAIEDLLRHGIKTFELASADHISIAKKIKPKSKIFITSLAKDDVRRGIDGILVEVKDRKMDYWRSEPREFDEKEMPTTRIQVIFLDHAKVKKTHDFGKGSGMDVEIETHVMLG